MEKIYDGCIAFIGILSIFGVYLGYFGLIYPTTSFIAIAISAIISWRLTKNIKTEHKGRSKLLLLILLLFFTVLIIPTLPNLIFPHGASDIEFHAPAIVKIAKTNSFGIPQNPPLIFTHRYPQVYYGVAAMLYSLYPHTYVVNSLFLILLEVLSLLGIFFIARELFDEKIALLSTFISGFAITNLFVLEQGYTAYLLGQFFFIASIYLFIKDEKRLLILANIGLLTYPHMFGIYLIFILLESIRSKKLENFIIPIISPIVLAPETLGLFWWWISSSTTVSPSLKAPFTGTLLLMGGIHTPPLISLLIFGFAIIGLYIGRRKNNFINLNLSIMILMAMIVGAFAYNFILGYMKDIRFLYFFVKFYYLLVFPLSLAAAVGIDKIIKKESILALMLLLYFLYFTGYAFVVLPQKANFPGEAYEIFEKMDTLGGKYNVGVDPDLINNKGWQPRFPYKSLVDVPDTGYFTGEVARQEMARAFGFHFVNDNKEEIDYYISKKEFDYPIVFKKGRIKVFKLT